MITPRRPLNGTLNTRQIRKPGEAGAGETKAAPPTLEAVIAHAKRKLAALRRERAQLLIFLNRLSPAQWQAPSAAEGWRVRDVVAHLGASARLLLGPGVRHVLRSANAEELNDALVDHRRGWEVTRVLSEFEKCSGRALVMLQLSARPPLGTLRLPIAELGSYPLRLTPSLLLFDWHVHLRHDIAPALGLPGPTTDADRMAGVMEWMTAGMEQMNRAGMTWVDRPLSLTLAGIGGGTWRIQPETSGRLRVSPGRANAAAEISGTTVEFPAWGTGRSRWRSADITITGDIAYAARFLDALNII